MDTHALAVDVSTYQRRICGAELLDAGVELVIVKSSSGLREDPRFRQHAEEVCKAGLLLGAYHWADPLISPGAQVDFWLRTVERYPVCLLMGDMEQWWRNWGTWYQAIQRKLEWRQVEKIGPDLLSQFYYRVCQQASASGIPFANYTSRGFVTSYAYPAAAWLDRFPLVTAHYGAQPAGKVAMEWAAFKANCLPRYKPLLPPGAQDWVGHQFTGDRYKLPGMYADDKGQQRSPADVLVFRRNFMNALQDYAGELVTEPEPPIAPPPTPKSNVWRITGALQLRDAPNGNALGQKMEHYVTPKDSPVTVLEERDGWGRIERGWFSLKTKWTERG